MMLKDIYQYLEKSESIYDFADAVVVVRLRQTRDLYMQELDSLYNLTKLNAAQQEDYETISSDVIALDRIIKLYDWTEDSNE